MTMSDSTEARPQQLDSLDDEEWMIGGTNYSIKCSRSQPNSGIKSLAGCLRCGHAPIVLQLLAFLLLAGLLVITLAQVSKGPNTQGQEESKHENLSLKLTQQKDELFSKVLSSQENKTRQVISEQLKQLKAELLSKISDQEQNKSMQKIPEQLSQLKAELLSKIPIPQGQNESMQKISEQLIQLKDDLVSKITIIQAQEDSKQEMISQQLTQLKAQLYNLCRPCPWDWTSFAGNCYFFSMSQRNWNDAVTACHEVGAQLVIVKSEEEQTFLQQTSKAKGLTWMGLSDLNREAAWLWVDGSPLSPSFQKYWNSGEPNNIGEEDCAEFSGTGWNDSKCDLRKFWICKKAETPCNTS